MKNSLFTVTLLGLISFGASAAQYNHHDCNVSEHYANELRLKAFEGETSYQVKVNPLLSVDRDEPVSTRHATELRLKAFEDNSFVMTQIGRTGGYDFSYDSVIDGANSHYRNHR